MPLDTPQTSQSPAERVVNGRYSANSSTQFQLLIITEGTSDAEAEGDVFLQELVDLLKPRYTGVVGMKTYASNTTQAMLPSS
ncbi:hypothetical protein ABZ608_41785 [Streptomyces sp. NPDC013172]|uniref:VWFA domain-containing protein n=1 Tax=Streptomyces atriruber TaxID=545121 RepID=A0ABV3C100_9ACTN